MKNLFAKWGRLFSRQESDETGSPAASNQSRNYLNEAEAILAGQGFGLINSNQAAGAYFMTKALVSAGPVMGHHCDFGKLLDDGSRAFLVSLIFSAEKDVPKDSFVVAIPEARAGDDTTTLYPLCIGLEEFVDTLKDQTVEDFFKALPKEKSQKVYSPRP